MTRRLGLVSQKGGVGKSTLARLMAREFAECGWRVAIADLDTAQITSTEWASRRTEAGRLPAISVAPARTAREVLSKNGETDLLIFDAPPHSMQGTKAIAQASDLVVLPTGLSLDDLRPTVLLAHELVGTGIAVERIAIALCRVGDRPREIEEAREYVADAGYLVLSGSLPERTAYRRVADQGGALTEVLFPTLRERAEELAAAIAARLMAVTTSEMEVA
ncbi:P-loop NTPase [Amorphus sp. 3PC139-8]|uniref:nucleotide-binding protein n=1 Tax=Amorphus sp. 3PC139-8 TaxID=2735676 RepID=UPI00345D8FFC